MPRKAESRPTLSDRERLLLFVAESDRLNEHKLVQDGFAPSLNISMNGSDQPWKQQIFEPEPEVLESYLLQLRRFMADDEHIFVHGIRSLARRLLPPSSLRDRLDDAHAEWKRQMKNAGVSMKLNDEEVHPAYAWDLYVNGQYFHVDVTKRERLSLFAASGVSWMIRWQFLNQIVFATEYIFEVSLIIEQALDEHAFKFAE
jgi:hypothetical protein